MVNAKNLLATSVVTLAVAAIVTYMSVNGLSDKDISLVDACYRSAQAKSVNAETCEDFKKNSYEWDTKIPCTRSYKEDVYYWTPRMMFMYFAGGKEEIGSLGRKNKGTSTSTDAMYVASNNMTLIEALEDRCSEMLSEPEYPMFMEMQKQFKNGVKVEDMDLSMFEDRNLYGWTEFTSWVIDYFNYRFVAQYVILSQPAADIANYKACSNGYGLQKSILGHTGYDIVDNAECSGRNPHRCKRFHALGPHAWWNNHERTRKNQLNRGCNAHDQCLAYRSKRGGECDDDLASAAWGMITWKWPGISCSWRGCRSWWFTWRNATNDSRRSAILVYCTMGWVRPNGN
jgi:hypothetical protein